MFVRSSIERQLSYLNLKRKPFIGIACIDPPVKNDENIQSDYVTGTTIAFGESVSYSCLSGHFFEADYYQVSFDVTCNADGSWIEPAKWPKCVRPEGNLLRSLEKLQASS